MGWNGYLGLGWRAGGMLGSMLGLGVEAAAVLRLLQRLLGCLRGWCSTVASAPPPASNHAGPRLGYFSVSNQGLAGAACPTLFLSWWTTSGSNPTFVTANRSACAQHSDQTACDDIKDQREIWAAGEDSRVEMLAWPDTSTSALLSMLLEACESHIHPTEIFPTLTLVHVQTWLSAP